MHLYTFASSWYLTLFLCFFFFFFFLLGRSAAHRVLERYRARTQEQANLNRGLSRSMGSLPIQNLVRADEGLSPYPPSEYHAGSESSAELYHQRQQQQLQQRGRPLEVNQHSHPHQRNKSWASSADLAILDPDMLRFGALEDARRGSSALSTRAASRHKSSSKSRDSRYADFGSLDVRKAHHHSSQSVGSAFNSAYDRIREKHKNCKRSNRPWMVSTTDTELLVCSLSEAEVI